ncbi:hypothetical protein D3C81_2257140 [compost metagenome]
MSKASRALGPDQGAWRLTINRDLGMVQDPPKQIRRSASCTASCSWPRPDNSHGASTLIALRW